VRNAALNYRVLEHVIDINYESLIHSINVVKFSVVLNIISIIIIDEILISIEIGGINVVKFSVLLNIISTIIIDEILISI
jgi:hypothetical protein